MQTLEINGSDELLDRLRASLEAGTATAPPAAETFASVQSLLSQEDADQKGDFIAFPDMPGMSVHVTGSLAVSTQYGEAEKRYRKEKNLGAKEKLPLTGQLRVSGEAYVDGHGVKSWRFVDGFPDPMPWSREKFVSFYIASTRFRHFIDSRWADLSGTARKIREDVRGE